ncbi:MAG TPA: hypothetical protein VF748_04935 [Candidatus Acidoferrum sp.]
MKKLAALVLFLFLTTGLVLADTPKDADPKPAKTADPAKPKAAKETAKSDPALAAEIEELRRAIQSQQEQLQLLKEELAKRDRQIDEARDAAAAANARAAEASVKANEAANSSAEVKSATATLNTTVSDLKTSNEVLTATVAKAGANTGVSGQGSGQQAENVAIQFKGITITPGGFVAAETVSRTRATGATINTPFNGIPYPGSGLAKVSESSFTARQSRLSLLAEGTVGSTKISGYYEADWLGTGVTSNDRQSNSYVFRQRLVFGTVALDNGWSVIGGQQWSLVTENRKGIYNRQEVIPLTIDPQYNVGFNWERQYAFRVVKNFSTAAFAVSIEAPAFTVGGRGFSTFTPATGSAFQNFFLGSPGQGGGLLNFVDTTGYSLNKAPDIIVKGAFDPGFGHYELYGIASIFRNRIYPCAVVTPTPSATTVINGPALTCAAGATTPSAAGAFNDTTLGGGAGASARFPLLAKKLDLLVKAQGGDGIGRYASAQLADTTAHPDGSLALIRGGSGLGELEWHPNAKLDVYAYYGLEYAFRAAYQGYLTAAATTTAGVTTIKTSNTAFGGYGGPTANNSGCSVELPPSPTTFTSATFGATGPTPANCAGDTRVVYEATFGFWHKFYQGPRGGFRWGLQYSYFNRSPWSGQGSAACIAAGGCGPKANDNMVWTSFRYYIP